MATIEKIIEEIRLGLQADGADCELIEKRPQGEIRLKISGHSKGCQSVGITLETAVEAYIRRGNSEIKDIVFQ